MDFPLAYGPLHRNVETPWSKEQMRLRTEGLTSACAQTTAEQNEHYGLLGPAGLRSGGAHAYQRHRSGVLARISLALCSLCFGEYGLDLTCGLRRTHLCINFIFFKARVFLLLLFCGNFLDAALAFSYVLFNWPCALCILGSINLTLCNT